MHKVQEIKDALGSVYDSELRKSLVELNMIRDIVISDGNVTLTLALTTLRCPLKEKIVEDIKDVVKKIPGITSVNVNLTAMSKEELDRLFPRHPLLGIEKVKHFIAVASGKGGVGKTTVGGEKLSQEMGVPLLGSIPIDIELRKGCDSGIPLMAGAPESKTAKVFREIAGKVTSRTGAVAK